MHLRLRDTCKQMVQSLVHRHRRSLRSTEDVGHHGDRGPRSGVAQWVVEDSTKVLFELAGDTAVHRPVATVVRAHRQLVHQERAIGGLEQLDRHHPDHTQFAGQRQRESLRRGCRFFRQVRCRRDHHGALSFTLDRFHHRPHGALAERRASHHRRQLPPQRDPLLDHQGRTRWCRRKRLECLLATVDQPHPAPVIAAADGFEDHLPVMLLTERDERLHRVVLRQFGVRGNGRPELGEAPPHGELVLGEDQRARRRKHTDTFADQHLEVLDRHVLVVEGQRVAATRRSAEVVEAVVAAEHHIGADLGGRLVGGRRQDTQTLPQCDGGLMGHARQLTTADHGDHGHPRGSCVTTGLRRRRCRWDC